MNTTKKETNQNGNIAREREHNADVKEEEKK